MGSVIKRMHYSAVIVSDDANFTPREGIRYKLLACLQLLLYSLIGNSWKKKYFLGNFNSYGNYFGVHS